MNERFMALGVKAGANIVESIGDFRQVIGTRPDPSGGQMRAKGRQGVDPLRGGELDEGVSESGGFGRTDKNLHPRGCRSESIEEMI